jgi:2'-5' RNA ligase
VTEPGASRDRARLFFALWPDASVQAALATLARDVQTHCGGRAIAQQNIHLTLFFVGAFERARMEALKDAAASAHAAAFSLSIDRLGYWRHNRILWAGARDCPAELTKLASRLSDALVRIGIHGEDRPYVPHVTLLRNAERRPQHTTIEPCTWRVKDFVLMESVSIAGGVRYEPLAIWPLAS